MTGSRIPVKGQKVTVNLTLSNPVSPTDMATEWSSQLGDANQSLYKIVGAECAILTAVLKGCCRLVQITTTGNINDRNNFGNPQPGTAAVNVNATATFEIEASAPPMPSAPR